LKAREELEPFPEIAYFIDFIEMSQRGVTL